MIILKPKANWKKFNHPLAHAMQLLGSVKPDPGAWNHFRDAFPFVGAHSPQEDICSGPPWNYKTVKEVDDEQ